MTNLLTSFDAKTFVWSSKLRMPQQNYERSIGEVIFEKLQNNLQHICQISAEDDQILLDKDVLIMGIRVALNLKKLALTHNDFVGICARNSAYLLPTCVGCYFNCTPFHAVNPNLDEESIAHLFDLTKPKIIFCDGRDYDKIYKCTKHLNPLILTLMEHLQQVPQIAEFLQPFEAEEQTYRPEQLSAGCDQTVAVLCSSGTSGQPKAVCISNKFALFEQQTRLCDSKDIILPLCSINWLSSFVRQLSSIIQNAMLIVTSKRCTAEIFAEIVQQYNVTYVAAPPEFIKPFLAADKTLTDKLLSVKKLIVGGSPMSQIFLQRTQQIFMNAKIIIVYGITECGLIAQSYDNYGADNNVGDLISGYSARIVDDQGKNLAHKQQGEVLLFKARKWLGYVGNEEATYQMQDAEGWFHTGDIGYFDAQNQLHIVDRKKEICKYMGCQYAPSEIEAVIVELPEVISCSVCGVYDDRFGDKAGALVIKKQNSKLTEKDIKQHVAKRLPAVYKHLNAGVLFVDTLPQNVNGKVVRSQVKKLLMNANAA